MRHHFRLITRVLVLFMAVAASSQGDRSFRTEMGGVSRHYPPSNAAARILPSAGACIQFISVFVPAQGGDYIVGVSFAYWDMNRDAQYTPGVDKIHVCVNCADACGWGP
jgi:hypothetical protein